MTTDLNLMWVDDSRLQTEGPVNALVAIFDVVA